MFLKGNVILTIDLVHEKLLVSNSNKLLSISPLKVTQVINSHKYLFLGKMTANLCSVFMMTLQ